VIHIITINLVIIVANTKLLIRYWAIIPSMSDMMDVRQSAIQYATYIVTGWITKHASWTKKQTSNVMPPLRLPHYSRYTLHSPLCVRDAINMQKVGLGMAAVCVCRTQQGCVCCYDKEAVFSSRAL
jgi:hypothetical protein